MNDSALEDELAALRQRLAEQASALARAETEARLYRAAREEAEQALRRSEEASRSKDAFLALLSHELRSPLNAILGWTQMLRGDRLPPDKRERAIEAVERNARAQAQLIEDLLDISRIISGKLRIEPRAMDLRSVLVAALDAVRPSSEAKGLRLTALLGAEIGAIEGDPDRLQQVVVNLLVNAVKFTPEGGEVALRASEAGGRILVEIEDTGQGIKPELLPHIFERFRQGDTSTTREHRGLGLGLSIVRHLVELHGGTVRAESAGEGQGATFIVSLPCSGSAPAIEQEAPASKQAWGPMLDGVRVVLVDDDTDAQEMLTEALRYHGAAITAAGSAAEARAAIDAAVPDVLISDIAMPGEDGYALIQSIRARDAARGGRVPAIALTARAGSEDRHRALAAGFQVHISKPVDPADLLAAVAALTGGGAPEGALPRDEGASSARRSPRP